MGFRYLVRVELFDVVEQKRSEAYESLHEVMKRAGYERTWATKAHSKKLPDATYLGTQEVADPIEVATSLQVRLRKLTLKARILVCKAPMGSLGAVGLVSMEPL